MLPGSLLLEVHVQWPTMSNGEHFRDDYQRVADRLSDEYKIVQDKIDKIGAFRFTIRGWTVTLVTGAILALASANLLSPFVPLFLLFLLGIFAQIEGRQNRNQDILEDRAFEIEAEFRRLHRFPEGSPAAVIMTPRIAHDIRDRSTQNVGFVRRFWAFPDRYFYWLLGGSALVVLFLLYIHPQQSSTNPRETINVVNGLRGGVSSAPETNKHPNQVHTSK